jgi:isopenicillin-N N-acyltransferase-like protein
VTATAVPLVRVTGEPFDVGYQHGVARAGTLRAFLGDDLCRISRLAPKPVTAESLRPTLIAYQAAIAAAAPRLNEEILGLAKGLGVPSELAVLLQVRREIIGFQRVPVAGDCTTYSCMSAGPDGGPVLAQTVDLNGNLDDQIAVLDIGLSGSARRVLVLSFGGLLGYLGINSDGLAIGLNLVLGGRWGPGLPPYLAIRHLLDNAGCVADALGLLRGLPLASSRSLMLADPANVACAEILGGEMRLLEMTWPAHTNHFLHPDFTDRDELNVFARNSSMLRLDACRAGLATFARAPGGADVEEHFALLSRPPVCVTDTGDIRRERTVAAVVLLPGRAEMHLRPGNPSRSATQTFKLSASTAVRGQHAVGDAEPLRCDHEAFDLLIRAERGVGRCQAVSDRGDVRWVAGRRHDGYQMRLHGAEDHALLHCRAGLEILLQRPHDHLLAVVKHDHIVSPAADEQEAVIVDIAQVPSADHAVWPEDALRFARRGVLIPGADRVLAPHADNAVWIEHYLLSGQHLSDAALAVRTGMVLGDYARLVQTVTLIDRHADLSEEPEH